MPHVVDRFNVDGQDYTIQPVIDPVPTQGSGNAVASGGVYDEISRIDTALAAKASKDLIYSNVVFMPITSSNVEGLTSFIDVAAINLRGSNNIYFTRYIACGSGTAQGLWYSDDGFKWVKSTSPAANDYIGLRVVRNTSTGGPAVYAFSTAVGSSYLWYTSNGKDWTACTGTVQQNVSIGVDTSTLIQYNPYNNKTYLLTDHGGNIKESSNGRDFSASTAFIGNYDEFMVAKDVAYLWKNGNQVLRKCDLQGNLIEELAESSGKLFRIINKKSAYQRASGATYVEPIIAVRGVGIYVGMEQVIEDTMVQQHTAAAFTSGTVSVIMYMQYTTPRIFYRDTSKSNQWNEVTLDIDAAFVRLGSVVYNEDKGLWYAGNLVAEYPDKWYLMKGAAYGRKSFIGPMTVEVDGLDTDYNVSDTSAGLAISTF